VCHCEKFAKISSRKAYRNQRKIALKTLFLVAETYSSAILRYVQLTNSILEKEESTRGWGENNKIRKMNKVARLI